MRGSPTLVFPQMVLTFYTRVIDARHAQEAAPMVAHSRSSKSQSQSPSATSQSKSSSVCTKDHQEIRRWVEERGGRPAKVRGTARDDATGVLRIDYPGQGDDSKLEPISWEEFFDKFDDNDLYMVMQERTADGEMSRFSKIIQECDVERESGGGGAASRSSSRQVASGGRTRLRESKDEGTARD